MRDPELFDEFYRDARERLLVQTYAMTGDLAASRKAVRDAFVVAWHRWRKLSQMDNPEMVVRPQAWRLAQRRHTARVWHRERDTAPDIKATLDALGKLSLSQRKALVLTQLATVSMPQMAREIGAPPEVAARDLQAGADQLALLLDVPSTSMRLVFETIGTSIDGEGQWPRATIIRRAGAARRRTQTTVGALGAVAALLVSGSMVTDATGVRPTLHRNEPPPPPPPAEIKADVDVVLPESTLLGAEQVAQQYDDRNWEVERTGDNSSGSGLVLPCQLDRYADPRGDATLVRTFTSTTESRQEALAITQVTEVSSGSRASERAFRTAATWFAGCAETRVQLYATRTPQGVGDESVQLVLRSWARPVTTYVVGIARTGLYTTTSFVEQRGEDRPDLVAATALLSGAVNRLCALPDAGRCAPLAPELVDRDPLPVGESPAIISEIDLPPVTSVSEPWVGTAARRAITNDASSACDDAAFNGVFNGVEFTRNATRTFVIPEAAMPQEFGLTETVGALPVKRAKALVDRVRSQLAACSERELNTEVDRVENRDRVATSITAWRLDIKVTDERSVTYFMAILREGTSLAQLGFLPADDAVMKPGAFVDLAERALTRLSELPPPRER